jgi:hypothetical protein
MKVMGKEVKVERGRWWKRVVVKGGIVSPLLMRGKGKVVMRVREGRW